MIKLKATKKVMKESYYRIVSAGYCQLDYLLMYKGPIAYSSGDNGWACDYYDIQNVLISTGYSPIANKNTVATYEIIHEYNLKAQKIVLGNMEYESKKASVENLLNEFIEKIRG